MSSRAPKHQNRCVRPQGSRSIFTVTVSAEWNEGSFAQDTLYRLGSLSVLCLWAFLASSGPRSRTFPGLQIATAGAVPRKYAPAELPLDLQLAVGRRAAATTALPDGVCGRFTATRLSSSKHSCEVVRDQQKDARSSLVNGTLAPPYSPYSMCRPRRAPYAILWTRASLSCRQMLGEALPYPCMSCVELGG